MALEMPGPDDRTTHPAATSWWSSLVRRQPYLHSVVVGPRKSGKTTFFTELARDDSVVFWPVRTVARARSADEVWQQLWEVLGVTAPADAPSDTLHDFLDAQETTVSLIVDEWDQAVDRGPGATPDACYEVLDALARFCLGQGAERAGRSCLGLALVTSLPDISDLEHFARSVQRPSFESLSLLISRRFQAARFPMLAQASAEAVVRDLGLDEQTARRVAVECGGWLWLLTEAAAAARGREWNDEVRAQVCDEALPTILDAAVLRSVGERPQVRVLNRTPLDYISRRLVEGSVPQEFGLPGRFDDPRLLPALLERFFTRTYLIVDTENLRIPFQHHAEVCPAEYPDGLRPFLHRHIGGWLGRLCREYGVADQDVWLIGRNDHRIDDTVGPTMPGQRLAPPVAVRDKAGNRDASDDFVLILWMAQQLERNSLARFVLVSGDADVPLLLSEFSSLDRVTVCTPWNASAKLAGKLPADRIRSDDLGVPRPPRISRARLRDARERQRPGSRGTA